MSPRRLLQMSNCVDRVGIPAVSRSGVSSYFVLSGAHYESGIDQRVSRKSGKVHLAELQPYADQWVAFSADGRRIVASGPDIGEVAKHLHEANLSLQNVVLDHIVFDSDEIFLGAAEFSIAWMEQSP